MIRSDFSFFGSVGMVRRWSLGLWLGCVCILALVLAQLADFSASCIGLVDVERVMRTPSFAQASLNQLE